MDIDTISEYSVKQLAKVLIIGANGIGSLMSNCNPYPQSPSLSSLICHMARRMVWAMSLFALQASRSSHGTW